MFQRLKLSAGRLLHGVSPVDTLADRSHYKRTWQNLTKSEQDAKHSVAGTDDEEHFALSGAHTVSLLKQLVGINQTDVVLEIGCGVGRVGTRLSSICREWIGTDISANMIDHAKRRLRGLPNVTFVELSGAALKEIPSSSVDVVYCTVVFMHLYEWDRYRYVLDAYRVLRNGGRLFCDNVDITSPAGRKFFDDALKFDPLERPASLSMTSSGDELSTYARWAGFQNIQVHRWNDTWVGVTGIKRE